MKLTVLGTSAAFAGRGEGCSSYLLTVGREHYLIDAGPGSVQALQNHIDYRELNGIILSHLHADHVSDIYTLRYAVYSAQRDGEMASPLPLYMSSSPEAVFRFIREAVHGEFDITCLSGDTKLDLSGCSVSFFKTNHPIETYAMRFEKTPTVIVYTADTGYSEGLVRFCRNADILLAEATLQEKDSELQSLGHMTARQAGVLAREAGARTLVLTHLWPEYDRGTTRSEARDSFSGHIETAAGGMVLLLSGT